MRPITPSSPSSPSSRAAISPNASLAPPLVGLPFADHMLIWDAADMVIENFERFARQIRQDETEFDRALATVLFTDIVDSTAQSAALGDRAWTETRAQHDRACERT